MHVRSHKSTKVCIWAGFSPLMEIFKQAKFFIPSMNYRDGVLNRELSIRPSSLGPETSSPTEPSSATTPHLALGVILEDAAYIWSAALGWWILRSNRYHTLKFRQMGSVRQEAFGWLPEVRAKCNVYSPFRYNTSDRSGTRLCSKMLVRASRGTGP